MSACAIKGCDMPAGWSVGVKLWGKGFPKTHQPAELHSSIRFCTHHKENPPHASAEFFLPETRAAITAQFLKIGRAEPDYEGSEWTFTMIPIE